jgi:hypothetical protein
MFMCVVVCVSLWFEHMHIKMWRACRSTPLKDCAGISKLAIGLIVDLLAHLLHPNFVTPFLLFC